MSYNKYSVLFFTISHACKFACFTHSKWILWTVSSLISTLVISMLCVLMLALGLKHCHIWALLAWLETSKLNSSENQYPSLDRTDKINVLWKRGRLYEVNLSDPFHSRVEIFVFGFYCFVWLVCETLNKDSYRVIAIIPMNGTRFLLCSTFKKNAQWMKEQSFIFLNFNATCKRDTLATEVVIKLISWKIFFFKFQL